MFIKKTTKTDPKTGKTYFAYHLVESTRTQKGPRQHILLYMGSQIELPEGDHKLAWLREARHSSEHQFLYECSGDARRKAHV